MNCASSTATGSVGMGSFTAVTGTITFAGCLMAGQSTEIGCNYGLTPVVVRGERHHERHGPALRPPPGY